MSLLQHSLELFGFDSIDDVTETNLKQAFKVAILRSHPDKGGNENDIEKVMNYYVFLAETLQRVSGGRATLQNIVSPDELKGGRADELINRVFEEFDNDAFNAEFVKRHINENRGYESWLRTADETFTLLNDGAFGNATQKPPTFSENDLNKVFETTFKQGSSAQTSVIIHPDQMAYTSGRNLGVALIEQSGGTFTSDPSANPEYTDLYSAFTSDNTISDKIPSFVNNDKTLEEILAEREKERNKERDNKFRKTKDDIELIAEYEKKKLEEQKQHLENIKKHFDTDNLRSVFNLGYENNRDMEKELEKEMKNFVINF